MRKTYGQEPNERRALSFFHSHVSFCVLLGHDYFQYSPNRELAYRIVMLQFSSLWEMDTSSLPVFKKGNKEDETNYRLISLLKLNSKFAESCVFDHFFTFITDDIYLLLHGFVKGRSTITQLLDTVHRIARSIVQGTQADIA